MEELSNSLSLMVEEALYAELITYPKPGLVSLVDNGSHTDMNHNTFVASIKALKYYFKSIAMAGYKQEKFAILNQLGLDAETIMLAATNGINTHRGAIFILGLLVAATAATIANKGSYDDIHLNLVSVWGRDLLFHNQRARSHGAEARELYKINNIVTDAAKGFPLIFELVEIYQDLVRQYDVENARIILFLSIMARLDDTNLIYRGGMDGLMYAKTKAAEILGVYQNDTQQLYIQTILLHHEFIKRNLSPGGCADVLAAVIFLSAVKTSGVIPCPDTLSRP